MLKFLFCDFKFTTVLLRYIYNAHDSLICVKFRILLEYVTEREY